jgi:hypothetical protein
VIFFLEVYSEINPQIASTAKTAKTTRNMITGICRLCEIIFNVDVNISLPGIVVTIKSPN